MSLRICRSLTSTATMAIAGCVFALSLMSAGCSKGSAYAEIHVQGYGTMSPDEVMAFRSDDGELTYIIVDGDLGKLEVILNGSRNPGAYSLVERYQGLEGVESCSWDSVEDFYFNYAEAGTDSFCNVSLVSNDGVIEGTINAYLNNATDFYSPATTISGNFKISVQ